jgi:hypothetical protein
MNFPLREHQKSKNLSYFWGFKPQKYLAIFNNKLKAVIRNQEIVIVFDYVRVSHLFDDLNFLNIYFVSVTDRLHGVS